MEPYGKIKDFHGIGKKGGGSHKARKQHAKFNGGSGGGVRLFAVWWGGGGEGAELSRHRRDGCQQAVKNSGR